MGITTMKEIKFADLSLVIVDKKTNTPHCKLHGAMNKVTVNEDNSGYWRCLTAVSNKNLTACRAGCNFKQ